MGVIGLEECDWAAVAARIESADGPIAWFWMAFRHQTTRQWQPVLLTIRGATRIEKRIYGYRRVLLGSEQLSPARAAARFRKGIVRARRAGDIPALRFTPPTYTNYPSRITTEPGSPYYLAPASEWPQFFSSWSLGTNGVVEPGLLDQLSGDAVPFFPSLHAALASLAYGVPASQLMTTFQSQVLVRLPDLRARIGELASEEGAIRMRIDEGKRGASAGCLLEAVWKDNAGDILWRRAALSMTEPGLVMIETGEVPAEMWVLLSDAEGRPVDRVGWSVDGPRPGLGPLDVRVKYLVTEGEGYQLEYKQALGPDKVNRSFAETVAAFANGAGGTILVGVTENAIVLGWDRPNARDMITEIVRNYVTDPVDVASERVEVDSKPVWVVSVAPQPEEAKPFRCADRVMVRANGTTRVASTSEHRRLASGPERQHPGMRWMGR